MKIQKSILCLYTKNNVIDNVTQNAVLIYKPNKICLGAIC